jgi:hypothetical protein
MPRNRVLFALALAGALLAATAAGAEIIKKEDMLRAASRSRARSAMRPRRRCG